MIPQAFSLRIGEDLALALGLDSGAWERLRLPLHLGLAGVGLTVGVAKVVQFISNRGEEVFSPRPLLDLVIGLALGLRRRIVLALDTENGGDGRLGRELGDEVPQLPPRELAVAPVEVEQVDAVVPVQVSF